MKDGKPRVAILTSLVDFSMAYSLVGIILDQARALKKHGYEYDLLCIKNFNRHDADSIKSERLKVRYILPQTRLYDYRPDEPAKKTERDKNGNVVLGFEEQVEVHFGGDPEKGWIGYREALRDYDVIIDHDLMFLSWHLPQNAAIRRCIEIWPKKNWLHWVHSGPSSPPGNLCEPSTLRFSAAPNSHYVYLNETQALEYSLMINTSKSHVSTVYNPKDIRDVYGFHPETNEMIDRYNLFDHDILVIYPFSTPRWKEKGVRQLVRIVQFWKKQGIRGRLVLINAHCNSDVDKPKIEAIEAYCKVADLQLDDDVIMTSRFADEIDRKIWRYTVPFRVVRELVLLSNCFIFPSVSECCSLIQAEASIAGKFMVLNRDFPPMLEFSHPSTMNYEFTKNDPDVNLVYYECIAREIWLNLKGDSAIMNATQARRTFYNRDWIFKQQLEPLLYRHFDGDPRQRPGTKRGSEPGQLPAQARPVIELEGPNGEIITAPLENLVIERRKLTKEEIAAAQQQRAKDAKFETVTVFIAPPSATIPAPGAPAPGPPPGAPAPGPPPGLARKEPDFDAPWDGMPCPVFGTCASARRERCYSEAGHCLMLDQEPADVQ